MGCKLGCMMHIEITCRRQMGMKYILHAEIYIYGNSQKILSAYIFRLLSGGEIKKIANFRLYPTKIANLRLFYNIGTYYFEVLYIITIYYLLGITLICFSQHSYDSLCQRGSGFVLVIWLIQLYLNLSLNLRIVLDMALTSFICRNRSCDAFFSPPC